MFLLKQMSGETTPNKIFTPTIVYEIALNVWCFLHFFSFLVLFFWKYCSIFNNKWCRPSKSTLSFGRNPKLARKVSATCLFTLSFPPSPGKQQVSSYLTSFPSGTFHTCLGKIFCRSLLLSTGWIPFSSPVFCGPRVHFFLPPFPSQKGAGLVDQWAVVSRRSLRRFSKMHVFQRQWASPARLVSATCCKMWTWEWEREDWKRNGFIFLQHHFLFLRRLCVCVTKLFIGLYAIRGSPSVYITC